MKQRDAATGEMQSTCQISSYSQLTSGSDVIQRMTILL